jgi:precorrin-8X/cobalt-precorrin-8 methylmutase
VSQPGPVNDVHPIEAESFGILAGRIDLSAWPPDAAAVVARVVHATADTDLGRSMLVPSEAVTAGVAALRSGAPVVCDVEMVRAGLARIGACCHLAGAVAGPGGTPTRSAVAAAEAAQHHPDGAILVCGCAPTALAAWLDLIEAGELRPALVVGLPVGFVGAAEVKERLAQLAASHTVVAITNRGERGGSAAACGAVHALARRAGRR